MCITIPSSPRCDRKLTPGSRLWSWLIESPVRLFFTSGLFYLLLVLLTALAGWPTDPIWLRFNLLFGISPFILFGLLLQLYPRWVDATLVRYTRYGLISILLGGAQILFFLAVWLSDGPGWLYLLAILSAWWLMLSTLDGISRLRVLGPRDQVNWVNYGLLCGMAVLLFSGCCLILGWHETADFALWAGVSGFLIPMVLLIVLNHLTYLQDHPLLH